MLKTVLLVFVFASAATANAYAESTAPSDDFPIGGIFLENRACKGDASDGTEKRIKITPTAIDSSFGLCTLHDPRRSGNKITVQVICKDPAGGALSSDVTFTIRDANTVDFTDQYETYRATLYRCPQ